MKYFSYIPSEGFELHDTAEAAKKAAETALDYERQEACEGWSDEVEQICWGELRQSIVETLRRPRTDDDYCVEDFDTIVDYGLKDL